MIANISRYYITKASLPSLQGDEKELSLPLIPQISAKEKPEKVMEIVDDICERIRNGEFEGIGFVGISDFVIYAYLNLCSSYPCYAILKVGKRVLLREIKKEVMV